MTLNWNRCQGEIWCSFMGLNLNHPAVYHAQGVYIIWQNAQTIKVGYGSIREGIMNDRLNGSINIYTGAMVTWAAVFPPSSAQFVRNYFVSGLHPVIENYPVGGGIIDANYPWT
jgi:hypothetical protein